MQAGYGSVVEVPERPVNDAATTRPEVRRRLRWGVLLSALLIGGVTVAAVWIWWPRDVFGPSATQVGFRLEVGEVGLVGQQVDSDHAVRLLDVEPVIIEGSVPAAISFFLCDSDHGIGTASGRNVVVANCTGGVTSIDSQPILLPGTYTDGPQLVAVVVPLVPGKVVVDGVRITYRDDGRSRTEHTGVGFVVEASP